MTTKNLIQVPDDVLKAANVACANLASAVDVILATQLGGDLSPTAHVLAAEMIASFWRRVARDSGIDRETMSQLMALASKSALTHYENHLRGQVNVPQDRST